MKNGKISTDGIFLIDKRAGETSFGVVKNIRSSLHIEKVGHAGTLDPFASGLLIILLNRGTKLSPFLMAGKKIYHATIRLGVETDTLDPTGRVVSTHTVPKFGLEEIRSTIKRFVGKIDQIPPAFSAVKHQGVRAYRLARKGLNFELKKRQVTVYELKVLAVELPDVTIEVKCSGGTYIRSLAADIGKALRTGGHLKSLRRTASGSFNVKDAVNSQDISDKQALPLLTNKLITLNEALTDMPAVVIDRPLADKVRQGYQPSWEELKIEPDSGNPENLFYKAVRKGELIAIMNIKKSRGVDHGKVRIERVLG